MAAPYLLIGVFPASDQLAPQTGRLDGHVQAVDGLSADGNGRFSLQLDRREMR